VEQYFMRDFDEEPAMLLALNERFRAFKAVVSFFGKNFDRYRLEDRMAALGIESAFPADCHLDLYHVSRRFFQGRYPNLKLKTLEARRLGFVRQGDLPGAECPEAFFQFLRDGDAGPIIEVFEHNFWDILSLATLTVELDRLMKDPESPLDRYHAGRLCMEAGELERAAALLEEAARDLEEGPEAFDASMRLLRLLKRHRDPKVEALLIRLVADYPDNPDALIEMAKHREHRSRDLKKALHYAERALSGLERWDDGSAGRARSIVDGRKRIERLKGKISKGRESGEPG
jgi:tetratricopeptide (TPR) repeat protein